MYVKSVVKSAGKTNYIRRKVLSAIAQCGNLFLPFSFIFAS